MTFPQEKCGMQFVPGQTVFLSDQRARDNIFIIMATRDRGGMRGGCSHTFIEQVDTPNFIIIC